MTVCVCVVLYVDFALCFGLEVFAVLFVLLGDVVGLRLHVELWIKIVWLGFVVWFRIRLHVLVGCS